MRATQTQKGMVYLSVYVKPEGETKRKVQKTSNVSVKVKHVTQLCKYTCIYFEVGKQRKENRDRIVPRSLDFISMLIRNLEGERV